MKSFIVILLIGLCICGCESPSLQDQLAARGVVYDRCPKIVIVGSESGYGSIDVTMVALAPEIQEVWDTIIPARPYDRRCACGYRRVEFYTHEDSNTPAATLLVNETGTTYLEDAEKLEGFYCPGLRPLTERLLRAKFKSPEGN